MTGAALLSSRGGSYFLPTRWLAWISCRNRKDRNLPQKGIRRENNKQPEAGWKLPFFETWRAWLPIRKEGQVRFSEQEEVFMSI